MSEVGWDVAKIMLGALAATIGGLFGKIFETWTRDRVERSALAQSLRDELGLIMAAIDKMHEVWTASQVLSPLYVEEISSNTCVFDNSRLRLFLLKGEKLRHDISGFYTKLKRAVKKSEGDIGSLSELETSQKSQAEYDKMFQELKAEAEKILAKIK